MHNLSLTFHIFCSKSGKIFTSIYISVMQLDAIKITGNCKYLSYTTLRMLYDHIEII